MNGKDLDKVIEELSQAEHAYYVLNKPIMSDGEYDKLFNELTTTSQFTGGVARR